MNDNTKSQQSLQELIDRHNSEILSKQQKGGAVSAAAEIPEEPAVAATTQAEREQWMRDLEQGLAELRQGLIDLEEGRRQLREGQLEYERAIAERKKWEQYAQAAASPAQNASGEENTEGGVCDGDGEGQRQKIALLRVVATTARQAEPIAGAHVSVTRDTPDGTVLYASVLTDISGRTPELRLPVDEGSDYTPYDVRVIADGYRSLVGLTVQMTSCSASTLRASLEPLPLRR